MTKKQLQFIINDIVTPEVPKQWILENLENEIDKVKEFAILHPRMKHFYHNGKFIDTYIKVNYWFEKMFITDYIWVRIYLTEQRELKFETKNAIRKYKDKTFINVGNMSLWAWHNKFSYFDTNKEKHVFNMNKVKSVATYKHNESIKKELNIYEDKTFQLASSQITHKQYMEAKDWRAFETSVKEKWAKLLVNHGNPNTKNYKELVLQLIPVRLKSQFTGKDNELYEKFSQFLKKRNYGIRKDIYKDYVAMCINRNSTDFFNHEYKKIHDQWNYEQTKYKEAQRKAIIANQNKAFNDKKGKLIVRKAKNKAELYSLGEELSICVGTSDYKVKDILVATYNGAKICIEYSQRKFKQIRGYDNSEVPKHIVKLLNQWKEKYESRKIETNY